jgi:hypothetical protein
MKKSRLVLAAASLAAALTPALSQAQVGNPFDHLKCYKIKDSTPKAKYTADLVPLQNPPFNIEPDCVLKAPAKLFCIPVQKTNVQPTPPGAVNGTTAQDYLLYKIKCPNVAVVKGGMPLAVADQFAARTILVGAHKLLLVPAFKQNNLCHNQAQAGTPPVCGGDCTNPNQKCVLHPGTTNCDCESPCGVDAAGACGGTCPFAGQNCQLVTLANGVVDCTCDPPVDTCHLVDPAARTCGGDCTDPDARCVLDSTGTCRCEKPCGAVGIRRCGGLCPNATDVCTVKPDDSGCVCQPTTPQPCGPDAATGQCGGVCPNNDTCVHSGPVPGGTCVCGPSNQ